MGFSNKSVLSGVVLVVAVAVLGGAAVAAPIVQTKTFSGTPTRSDPLTFDMFDTQGGARTLTSVEVILNLSISGGSLKVDNDGQTPASGIVHFGAESLLSSSMPLVDGNFVSIIQSGDVKAIGDGFIQITADDGDQEVGGTDFFSYKGTDYGFYNGTPQHASKSGFVNPSAIGAYAGNGQYTITVNTTQIADYSALGGMQAQIDPLDAVGSLEIIYTYTPEPATMGLLLLGCAGMLRRRRAA